MNGMIGQIFQDQGVDLTKVSGDVEVVAYLQGYGDTTTDELNAAIQKAPEAFISVGMATTFFAQTLSQENIPFSDIDSFTAMNSESMKNGSLEYLAGKYSSSIGPVFALVMDAINGNVRVEFYSWVIALCYKKEISGNDYYQITMQDISELEEKISMDSLDFGTGLWDKKTIVEYAKFRCAHPSGVFNLCILDIDNFKNINDTKGHSFGDKVLKDVSTTIRNILGSHGKAGRIGGDEMMLIIDDAPDNPSLRTFLKPIRESIQNLYRDQNGNPLRVEFYS